jgi:DNA-binding MarR family transcriptional regulator
MDQIKEAFDRVKNDMDTLRAEIEEMKKSLIELCQIIEQIAKKDNKSEIKEIPTHPLQNPTIQHIIPTHSLYNNPEIASKQPFSTGNRGVPTDRQTNQQTDKSIEIASENSIKDAAEMLKSLDNIKREVRKKFKKLTEQEWLVFSTIYQLDEQSDQTDYRILADKLNLTESSIRDYVRKLIKKGIPVEKTKLNNKNIQLNISKNLKQIASLSTIIALRDT